MKFGLEEELIMWIMKTSITQIWMVCHLLPFAKVGQNCSCDDISDNKRVRVRVMTGFLVRGRVRIKIRVRIRVAVTFNVSVYHWSNCRRSKCRTFCILISRAPWETNLLLNGHHAWNIGIKQDKIICIFLLCYLTSNIFILCLPLGLFPSILPSITSSSNPSRLKNVSRPLLLSFPW